MTDSFLQSMTFSRAGQFLNACACEECDIIPPSIRNFIEERKRQRLVTGPIKRTQQRTLVSRHGQISLWSMHMPKNAEPLVEFGSSHRIVWVKQLATSFDASDNNSSTLRWIGKGIIGSSDEEKSRKEMIEWTEGNVFLVPSNGGKAVGWIHSNADPNSSKTDTNDDNATGNTNNEEKHDESDSFAVLYVAKIPPDILKQEHQESRESYHQWANQLIECCRDGLKSCEKQSAKNSSYYKFSGEASKLLKKAIREVEGITAKNDATERASKRICLNQQVT